MSLKVKIVLISEILKRENLQFQIDQMRYVNTRGGEKIVNFILITTPTNALT